MPWNHSKKELTTKPKKQQKQNLSLPLLNTNHSTNNHTSAKQSPTKYITDSSRTPKNCLQLRHLTKPLKSVMQQTHIYPSSNNFTSNSDHNGWTRSNKKARSTMQQLSTEKQKNTFLSTSSINPSFSKKPQNQWSTATTSTTTLKSTHSRTVHAPLISHRPTKIHNKESFLIFFVLIV